MKPILLLALTLLLTACDTSPSRSRAMPTLDIPDTLKEQLAFTCAYEAERIPPRNPEADKLFKHARYLQKKNLLKEDPAIYPVIERLYRIAAAWGHDKAAHNLINFLMHGHSTADDLITLPVDLAEDLIKRGIPQGYYDMGYFLSQGYGVKSDQKAAMKYFRKAADLGNPDAQWYLGDKMARLGFAHPVPYEIGRQMIQCAGDQGHADAANSTGVHLHVAHQPEAAIKYYQLAIKAGNSTPALESAFAGRVPDIKVEKDAERERRYEIISDILEGYSYANPTVEELDEIVPLPPAKLPPWDGTIKWLKEWEADVPPPLPDEKRITAMAKEKGLDPKTGRPLPPKPQATAPAHKAHKGLFKPKGVQTMKRSQNNTLNMGSAVLELFATYPAIWSQKAVIKTGHDKLLATVTAIRERAQMQTQNDSKGYTVAKEIARDALEDAVFQTAARLRSYANAAEDATLHTNMSFSRSALDPLKTNELTSRARAVVDACETRLDALADFEIDAASVAELRTQIDQFEHRYALRDTVVDQRMEATDQIAQLIVQARQQLKGLDDLVDGYIADQTFAAAYFNARRIHDLKGGGNTKPQTGQAKPAVVNA